MDKRGDWLLLVLKRLSLWVQFKEAGHPFIGYLVLPAIQRGDLPFIFGSNLMSESDGFVGMRASEGREAVARKERSRRGASRRLPQYHPSLLPDAMEAWASIAESHRQIEGAKAERRKSGETNRRGQSGSALTFDQERLHTYVVTTHVLEALVGVDRPDFDSTTTS
ncbi:hypothetical protein CPB86DRAFT_802505 [Serendipita vermifera]|nr:hypothetical protein CPB86DRAFT_802505 [Serendipita vermifera]